MTEEETQRVLAVRRAREQYGTDDVEIDQGAPLSIADNGVWVQAWVWVPNEELEDTP